MRDLEQFVKHDLFLDEITLVIKLGLNLKQDVNKILDMPSARFQAYCILLGKEATEQERERKLKGMVKNRSSLYGWGN